MSKLEERAVEAYAKCRERQAEMVAKLFSKEFGVEPEEVAPLRDRDADLIRVGDLLIRTWLAANGDRWYGLVIECERCGSLTSFYLEYPTQRSTFTNPAGLGWVISESEYKPKDICPRCKEGEQQWPGELVYG